jgi:hypothetical protein
MNGGNPKKHPPSPPPTHHTHTHTNTLNTHNTSCRVLCTVKPTRDAFFGLSSPSFSSSNTKSQQQQEVSSSFGGVAVRALGELRRLVQVRHVDD